MPFRIGLVCAAVLAAGSVAALIVKRRRRDPLEKERRRRAWVNSNGRLIEGYVTSCENGLIVYSYHWRGVRYEASQVVDELIDTAGYQGDFSGPVTVKFLTSQPSNSIVLAENWSGIRAVGSSKAPNRLTPE